MVVGIPEGVGGTPEKGVFQPERTRRDFPVSGNGGWVPPRGVSNQLLKGGALV